MRLCTTLAAAVLAIASLAPSFARALVIGTDYGNGADTYINGEGTTYHHGDSNFGLSSTMILRRASGDYTRKAYVRFDLGTAGIHANGATLKFSVHSTTNQSGGDTTINVWGLNDGVAGVDNSSPPDGDYIDDEDTHDEFWPETVIDWFSAPANSGDTTVDTTKAPLLGTFVVPKDAPQYTQVTFTDPALLSMIQSDTNGVVSFIMQPAAGTDYINFYTKEGSATYQPVLEFSSAALAWDGGGVVKHWTQQSNWNPDGLPLESATFGDTGTAARGTVTNIVDETYLVGELNFEQLSANYHTMEIVSGATLTVHGDFGVSTANAVTFGNTTGDGSNSTVITGGGSLVVNSPTKDLLITSRNYIPAEGNPKSTLTVDMSGLANFEATINEFRVLTGYLKSQATVTLAQNNTITADAVVVSSNTGVPYVDVLQLGQDNTIHANKLVVAGARSKATLEFDPDLSGTRSIAIRGKAGGDSRADVWIADQGGAGGYGAGGSSRAEGTIDFRGATLDARINSLVIGRNGSVASKQPGAATGSLSFDAGAIDANTIYVGLTPMLSNTDLSGYDLPNEGHTYGTLNMGGGTLSAGSMHLGQVQGSAATTTTDPKPRSTRATGTFNLSGGTATAGSITLGHHASDGPSEGTGLINVTGGTLNVTDNLAEGTGGAISISALNVEGGTVDVGGDLIVDSLTVGLNRASGSVSAGGNVQIGDSGDLRVGCRTDDVSGPTVVGSLDLRSAGSVAFNLDSLRLGETNESKARGELLLSSGTNSIDATVVRLGYSSGSYQDVAGDESRIELNGTTTIHASQIDVGVLRSRGIVEFGAGGGTLYLGSETVRIGSLRLGYNDGGTSSNAWGVLDLSKGTVQAYVDQLALGRHPSPYTTGGSGTGILSIADGLFDVNDIIMGEAGTSGDGSPGTGVGIINLSGNGILRAGTITQADNGGDSTATINFTGGVLHAGTIGFTLDQNGGILAPGTSVGTTTIEGNYNMNDGFLEIEFDSPSSYDQLIVTGDVHLNGGLRLVLNFEPEDFYDYTIVDNQGLSSIDGIFDGLAEGDEVIALYEGLEHTFVISYMGGDGNDIVLANVPEPAGLLLLALGAVFLLTRRRVSGRMG